MEAKMEGIPSPARETDNLEKIKKIFQRIFRDYRGNLAIWSGKTEIITFGKGKPDCILIFNRLKPLYDLLRFRDPLLFADAYFRGWMDIEGDIYSVLKLKDYLKSLTLSGFEKISFWLATHSLNNTVERPRESDASWMWLKRPAMPKHSKDMNREAIRFHYDVSNEFYKLWLDERMVYSCAYFAHSDDSLDNAQQNKLDLICRKLQLRPNERLLDIGCGWGALVIWAAQNYGVTAHGITLSQNQYNYALQKVKQAGLEGLVSIELKDYRDLTGEAIYDKVSSVGMFEHVGIKNLPVYFSMVHRLLKSGGLFLNHGITQDEEGGSRTVGSELIAKYVFPDGELDRISNIQREMERSFFEIHDVESLRPHYLLTLQHWVKRLDAHHEEVLQYVSEQIFRIWRLYMAGCALQFESGEMGVYQILAAKRSPALLAMPLTRDYLYK